MSNNASRRMAALVLTGALLLAGCGDDEISGELVTDGIGCQPDRVERRDTAPTVEAIGDDAPEGVDVVDLEEGDGCIVDFQSFLGLDVVGTTADGTVFTDTYSPDGPPLVATLGTATLLPGLEEGLLDMEVGGQRQITIPPALAYGEEGDPTLGIGPDETLRFVVDVVSVTSRPVFCSASLVIPEGERDGKPTEVDMPVERPTELSTEVLEPGDGAEATPSSYVTVDYLGVACSNGQQFDSSWDREEEGFTIAMDDAEPTPAAGSVIPGWTEGLVGAVEGSLVRLEIPPALAYGSQGSPPAIGPDDPLVFLVRIIEVSDEPPAEPEIDAEPTPEPEPEDDAEPTP